LRLLPRQAAGRELRHVVEVRHDSFRTKAFIALLREYGVGVVIAGDSRYPQIADATAPFFYARIMGTQPTEECGYSDAALDLWASRARAMASGAEPPGLDRVLPEGADGVSRDVYLYVIGGHKVYNPAAAASLMRRLTPDGIGPA
jgi:uncharacterized protein YecE (DUF72 family)